MESASMSPSVTTHNSGVFFFSDHLLAFLHWCWVLFLVSFLASKGEEITHVLPTFTRFHEAVFSSHLMGNRVSLCCQWRISIITGATYVPHRGLLLQGLLLQLGVRRMEMHTEHEVFLEIPLYLLVCWAHVPITVVYMNLCMKLNKTA